MASGHFGEFSHVLEIVGAISACFVTLKVGAAVFRLLRRSIRRSLFPVDVNKYGQWAVVTGASSGIGKSYAFKLSEKGMNVVLISNEAKELSDVAAQIRDQHKVAVKVIVADFRGLDIYPDIKRQLSTMDVGVLVNNVGITRPMPHYFLEGTDNVEQFYKDMVNVNAMSYVMMTTAVLPGMLNRQRGAIINIASVGGTRPIPFFTTYSATKAFVRYFSEALNMEYSSQGITVQAVTPSYVQTAATQGLPKPKGAISFPTSDLYVTSALRTLGHESTTTGYWPQDLETFVLRCLPDSILYRSQLARRNLKDNKTE